MKYLLRIMRAGGTSEGNVAKLTLEDILNSKERRALMQEELRNIWKTPVISITINIPGPEKDLPVARQMLRSALSMVRIAMEQQGSSIREERLIYPATGPEAVMAVEGDYHIIKRVCVDVEEKSLHGRLYDIDIFSANGKLISRSGLNLHPRRCFVCRDSSVLCIRSQKHSEIEIHESVNRFFQHYASDKTNPWPPVVWNISALALEAALMEAACTPAPGLVDRFNSGAHPNMAYFTLLKSCSVISGALHRCVVAGISHNEEPCRLLPVLRIIGREGEEAMFRVTDGVNRHRGLLFTLGVLCAAAGLLFRRSVCVNSDDLLNIAAQICQGMTERELRPLRDSDRQVSMTAGERLYLQNGITGIRGEAEAGFPALKNMGLPLLREALAGGLCLNDALVHTLLGLMTVVQDTTVVNRNGKEALEFVQQESGNILAGGGMLVETGKERVNALDSLFVNRNISPGGSADLLAATYFVYSLAERFSKEPKASMYKSC
jgi:holo-ACP synthase/triphosphoribosyl-dephospho-CoA synthase